MTIATQSEMPHYEQQYLALIRRVWDEGDKRIDRTGVGTRALFGETMRFSLCDDAIPLLTTKRIFWKIGVRELLWFLSGSTNIRPLVAQNVSIWTAWPLQHYRRDTGEDITQADFEQHIRNDALFAEKWGALGPIYGAQWVNWPRFEPIESKLVGEPLYRRAKQGYNQICALVDSLRHNSASRRHIFTGWNVADLQDMALPPCHMTYQFHVDSHGGLSCLLFQRSCDLALGFAYNIFEAALLTHMLAQQCGLSPRELIWSGGDVHLYLSHEDLVQEQLQRTPAGAPKLLLHRKPKDIFSYCFEDFTVVDYTPQAHIVAPVAV